MTDKIEIELPDKRFMCVKMNGGKAEVTFSDHCQIDGHYNLEIREGGSWALPTEKEEKPVP